jgi:hypothetical protein
MRSLLLFPALLFPAIALLCVFFAIPLQAKDQSAAETATLPAKVHHQLLLVLPFDNRSGNRALDSEGD